MATIDTIPLTSHTIAELAEELIERGRGTTHRRLMVGIAGIPGAGKSTLAGQLLDRMTAEFDAPGEAVLIPMDGFHLPNARLHEMAMSRRKGAPETFDVNEYIVTLARLRDPRETGAFPIYDRSTHEPVVPGDAAHTVTQRTRVVLTEGNYLLLDEPPWRALAGILDETWWLDTPTSTVRERLMARHRAGGRSHTEAEHRYVNDARNMWRVLERGREPDRVLSWPEL